MRAVLVGCGNQGGQVLLPAALSAGIEVTALVDTDVTKAKDLAGRWGVNGAYARLDQIQDSAVDAAILALPISEQSTQVTEALNRGWNVFVEKPPAADPQGVRALAQHAERSGLICAVGMNFRYAAGISALRRRLGTNGLGNITYVRVAQHARKPVVSFDPELMSLEASLFHAQGIHAIDLALWLSPDEHRIEGQLIQVQRGRMFALAGGDRARGTRTEVFFGSSAAGLYHQVDVFLDTGGMLSLRNLAELQYFPAAGAADVEEWPGSRVLWRRSPTDAGYHAAGYATELAAFRAKVADPGAGAGSTPDVAPVVTVEELQPTYDTFDQVLRAEGLSWTP